MPVNQLFDLSGRVAIVTGGSRGLGEAIATGLAEAGARVAITSTNEADIIERASQIADQTGGQILGIAGDIADEADCERVVAEAREVRREGIKRFVQVTVRRGEAAVCEAELVCLVPSRHVLE